MRVLQIAWEYPPRLFGGLGRHVEGLSTGLAALGVKVDVLTPGLHTGQGLDTGPGFDNGEGAETPPPAGIDVWRAGNTSPPLPPEQWIGTVLDENIEMVRTGHRALLVPDVLHAHDWMAGLAAERLADHFDVPLVVTVHATERGRHQGYLPPGVSPWIDAQERHLVASAHHVIVCSRYMADYVTNHLGADPATVSVIPNGVQIDDWRAVRNNRRESSRTRSLPLVVYAGRLEYEKGVQVLLAAARNRHWRVVIAGEGTYGQALRDQVGAGTGPTGRVRFVGHIGQRPLARLLERASVAVVPSLYEPFGLAALEAMAAGTPVVASDVGGLPEVLADGCGVLAPPDDPGALTAAISRVLRDRRVRDRLVRRGHRRVAELPWSTTASVCAEIYQACSHLSF